LKQLTAVTTGILMVFMIAGAAQAIDIHTLDRVSVLMTKTAVLALLGKPDDVVTIGSGMKAEIYRVNDMAPMVGVGCVYEEDQRLVGQAYIFQEEMGKDVAERLRQLGFTVLEDSGGVYRLVGKDDDTSQPVVVHISPANGATAVVTFEKGFYERRVQ
jgi:hypothetical protein